MISSCYNIYYKMKNTFVIEYEFMGSLKLTVEHDNLMWKI